VQCSARAWFASANCRLQHHELSSGPPLTCRDPLPPARARQAADEEAASGQPSPALAALVADYSTKLGTVYWDLRGAFRAQKQYACAHFLAAAAVPGQHQVECFTHLGHYYRWGEGERGGCWAAWRWGCCAAVGGPAVVGAGGQLECARMGVQLNGPCTQLHSPECRVLRWRTWPASLEQECGVWDALHGQALQAGRGVIWFGRG
jgi:hypothetical protein